MLRDITIHAVANGYVVTVGCQTFVFQGREEMLSEINSYLKDPEGTEKRYQEREFNMRYTLSNSQTPMPAADNQLRNTAAGSWDLAQAGIATETAARPSRTRS